jgi:hypothetical protein
MFTGNWRHPTSTASGFVHSFARLDPWIFLSRPLATISGKPSDHPNKFRKVRSR